MRRFVLIALTVVVSLVVASGAQAVVVDMNALGQTSVPYNPSDQSGYYGVALATGSDLATAGVPTVTASASCTDPWLASDLGGPILPANGLCWHSNGTVIHSNETFDLAWDPMRRDWATTRDYVEQFLQDVANGSGTLTSPYADTSQYHDANGAAQNESIYGGGCIDYGSTGGSACQFGSSNGSGPGNDYPASGCPVTGTNQFYEEPDGGWSSDANDVCLTDTQIQGELSTMIAQEGLVGHIEPNYTPLLVVLTPPGVEVCLDSAGTLCSANGGSTAQFCSYHSHINVGGTDFPYVVQPWVAQWTTPTGCVEPDSPKLPLTGAIAAQTMATDVGAQLVSPLSQAQIAAIVNPDLNGWFGLGGAEINDNGCIELPDQLDSVTVGTSSQNPYFLEREFNNAGVIESDPNAPSCTSLVDLEPTFLTPSAVNQGDVVEFDGSKTVSTLMVPNAGYAWNFGDGSTAVGPSVVHTYTAGGAYTVKLTVTDRGGYTGTLSQTVNVLGPTGKVVPPPTSITPTPGTHVVPPFSARIQLMPQGLQALLRHGLSMRVSSDEAANGFVTLSISSGAARRAHIKAGHGPAVVVGRGTVSGIVDGTASLHVRFSRSTARKLGRLARVTLTVRLALTAAGGAHVAVDAAGRY
jgi:hypothetical protein